MVKRRFTLFGPCPLTGSTPVDESLQHQENLLGNAENQWAVVVAQLAERSLLTPEICGSNPDISTLSNVLLSGKDENQEKEAGQGPFKKMPRIKQGQLGERHKLNLGAMPHLLCINL